LRPGTALLPKPYTAQELGSRVREVLDASRPQVGVGGGEIESPVRS
jgi:hypothetical protein